MCQEVNNTLLIEYLDSTADAWVAAHILRCPSCRERVATWSQAQDDLGKLLNPIACPSNTELGEYYLSMLSLERGHEMFLHLKTCLECQDDIDSLASFVDDQTPASQILYPFIASTTARQMLAYRDSSPTHANEFTYQIEEAEINISIQESTLKANHHTLLGLATGVKTGTRASADLIPSGSVDLLLTTPINPLGDFVISDIPSGKYELQINTPDIAYVLRGIQL